MKSRTSFFDATHFRKNLTRFAPAWALYGVLLLLILITMVGNGSGFGLDRNLTDMLQIYPVANIIYAFLVAQLLWGDLYNSRMCNALHALPLRREGWFATNFLSGISFSLIPTLAALLFCLLPLSFGYRSCDNGFLAPLMVFLGANAQYLFFFGLATLSAFLVGSRFAMAVVYGILNFASLIVYWLADTLYVPMLSGVKTMMDPFNLFSPVVQMCSFGYLDVEWLGIAEITSQDRGILQITDGWGYAGICAAVGLALTALALLLYRRRKLECAGDFIAVRALEPVFLTVYTLVVGCVFQMIFGLFNGNDLDMFLFVGLVIGFFTGRMFLKRTVRVFQWKAWGKCAILIGAFLLTLLLTWLDPLGIQSWMPKENQIRSVTVYGNHSGYDQSGSTFTVEDSEGIADILRVHELVVTGQEEADVDDVVKTEPGDSPNDIYTQPVMLEYEMKDGRTVRRCYYIWTDGEAGQILKAYFAAFECVLGITEAEIPAYAATVREVYVDGEWRQLDYAGLLQAMAEDCREGNLIQLWNYRNTYDKDVVFYVEFVTNSEWKNIRIHESCRHTLAWLEEHGIDTPNYDEKFG